MRIVLVVVGIPIVLMGTFAKHFLDSHLSVLNTDTSTHCAVQSGNMSALGIILCTPCLQVAASWPVDDQCTGVITSQF